MRGILLGLAAVAAMSSAVPATAQSGAGAGFSNHARSLSQFSGSSTVRTHRGPRDRGGFGDFRGDDRRGDRNSGGDVYFPYRDYEGDTLWQPDSFNDWWHDRPDRSFPRWVGNNANCQRMWWSGSGWRC